LKVARTPDLDLIKQAKQGRTIPVGADPATDGAAMAWHYSTGKQVLLYIRCILSTENASGKPLVGCSGRGGGLPRLLRE
jgi:hypothetical protein